MEEKKTHYYFWDEMWNQPPKQKNEDEKIITKNQLENNKNKP